MKPEETCPTCGTKLGPLQQRDALRRCDACQRPNPRGFRYCGFCAAPLETDVDRAERVEVAAPAGGWPSLSRELVELRFFLDRGELDEAYELLSILHQRHPGHPGLVDFNRGPATHKPRPDTQVYQVVDAVLADSSSLSASALPRRAVPQWNAPVVDDGEEGKKTRSHAVVPLGADEEEPTSRRAKVAEPAAPKKPSPVRARTDKHLGAVPVAKSEAAAKRGKSGASKAVRADAEALAVPKKTARPGHTVAVPTLQPPKPFAGAPSEAEVDEDARPTKIMSADKALRSGRGKKAAAVEESPAPAATKKPDKGAVRKRMLEPELGAPAKAVAPRKPTGKQAAAPKPAEPEGGKKRTRPVGARFGQNVLGRLGGKGKG